MKPLDMEVNDMRWIKCPICHYDKNLKTGILRLRKGRCGNCGNDISFLFHEVDGRGVAWQG